MLEEVSRGVGSGDHEGVERVLGVMTRMVVLHDLPLCTQFVFVLYHSAFDTARAGRLAML